MAPLTIMLNLLDCSCFKHCASYEKPADVDTTNVQTCVDIQEEFVKQPLTNGEVTNPYKHETICSVYC